MTDNTERCYAVLDSLICTREAGHSISVGHYDAGAGSGWVEVPDEVHGGVDVCRHGKLMVFDPSERSVPMAAPYFWCECCLRLTFYIASSSATFDTLTGESHGHSTVVHTELCHTCGGGSWSEEW